MQIILVYCRLYEKQIILVYCKVFTIFCMLDYIALFLHASESIGPYFLVDSFTRDVTSAHYLNVSRISTSGRCSEICTFSAWFNPVKCFWSCFRAAKTKAKWLRSVGV